MFFEIVCICGGFWQIQSHMLGVKFLWIYGFEHFILNIFRITKPQYTDSCTKFFRVKLFKTIQQSVKNSPLKYLVYTVASWLLCDNHWHNTYQHVNTSICCIITLIGTIYTANILYSKLTVLIMFHSHDNKYLKIVWRSFWMFMPNNIH